MDASDAVAQVAAQRYGAGSVVVCSACVTDELVSSLISLHATQRQVLLMVTTAPERAKPRVDALKRTLAPLDSAGVVYVMFTDVFELETTLQ